jgi:hypothetical protein
VFFDATKTPWVYEKEGYELPSGRYLPDFWLPSLDCWVEIKGEEPTAEEAKKAEELGAGTGWAVVIADGLPLERPLRVYCCDDGSSSGGVGWWMGLNSPPQFAKGDDGSLCIWSDMRCRSFAGPTWEKPFRGMRLNGSVIGDVRTIEGVAAELQEEAAAARSARFEYGESGGTSHISAPANAVIRRSKREFAAPEPHDVTAEKQLINLLLASPDLVKQAAPAISPDEIGDAGLRRILVELYMIQPREAPNMDALRERLHDRPDLYEVAERCRDIGLHTTDRHGSLAKLISWYAGRPARESQQVILKQLRDDTTDRATITSLLRQLQYGGAK